MENCKKAPNCTSTNENHNVWNKKIYRMGLITSSTLQKRRSVTGRHIEPIQKFKCTAHQSVVGQLQAA